jgi:hypothetical protein
MSLTMSWDMEGEMKRSMPPMIMGWNGSIPVAMFITVGEAGDLDRRCGNEIIVAL